MKILCIGNSFSDDACEHLYGMFHSLGDKDVVIGHIYIPGCPLSLHAENIRANAPAYEYRRHTKGVDDYLSGYSVRMALQDDDWDVVTMQQCSHFSGLEETYNEDIDTIFQEIALIRPKARVFWHMTWAYEDTSDHPQYYLYNHSRPTMYKAIVHAVQSKIVPDKRFAGIIPCGTAIENARAMGRDDLSRDGFHLSLGVGRYLASLTFIAVLTGKEEQVTFIPEKYPETEQAFPMLLKCVQNAVKNPFSVS